jgi:hypothetical protein
VSFDSYDEVEVGGEVDALRTPGVPGAFARGCGRADLGKDFEDGCIEGIVLFSRSGRVVRVNMYWVIHEVFEDGRLKFVTGSPILDVDFRGRGWGGG